MDGAIEFSRNASTIHRNPFIFSHRLGFNLLTHRRACLVVSHALDRLGLPSIVPLAAKAKQTLEVCLPSVNIGPRQVCKGLHPHQAIGIWTCTSERP